MIKFSNIIKTFSPAFIWLGCLVISSVALFGEVPERLRGYHLPDNHPAAHKLEQLFSDPSLLESRSNLVKAGFIPTEHQGANSVTLKHPSLKGYIVKLVTDQFPVDDETVAFITRIDGERLVRKCIKKHGWEDVFKVPRQWIYVLPHPSEKRTTLILAEDADILPHYYSAKWYREKINKSILRKIYRLTTEVGLQDCCRKTNLPRTKDGRLAVVDTELFHAWPVDYPRLINSLNSKMQKCWIEIIEENKT